MSTPYQSTQNSSAVRSRIYAGIVGPPGSRVISVNQSANNLNQSTRLASGAEFTMRADGAWLYKPSVLVTPEDGICAIDCVAYEIIDNGRVTSATLDFTVHRVEPHSVMTEQSAQSRPSDQSRRLLIRTTTHTTIVFNPYDAIDSGQRATLILEESPKGKAVTNADGSIAFTSNAGFVGETDIKALVEGPGGVAESVNVHIEVHSPVSVRNSLATATSQPTRRHSLPAPSSTVFQFLARSQAPEFDGTARPGSRIAATAYNTVGQPLIRTATSVDASGRWELRLAGLNPNSQYHVHFSEPGGSSTEYGYFTVNPPGPDYERIIPAGCARDS